ncbi:MAG: phosphotriesterase [Oscillospiraceae bacterium]
METGTLMTVTGPVPADAAGFCQSHEHLFLSKGRSFEVSPVLYMDDVEKSTAEARLFKAAGGGTLIDAQPVGCGRMCRELKQVSLDSGVNILSSTGFHKMLFYQDDHWIFNMGEDELTRLFISELTDGMFDVCDYALPSSRTDIKAGLIKAALDNCEFSVQYHRVFAAAANAAIDTGRSMMVHIEQGSDPLALLRLLLDMGVNPGRLIFCHTDRACESSAVRLELLSSGIFLEMDTIGRFKYHSDEREIEILRELLDAGFEKQLLFSLDTTNARMKSYTPDAIGLDYLIKTFVPMLKNSGVTDEQINLISHTNCVRAFSA